MKKQQPILLILGFSLLAVLMAGCIKDLPEDVENMRQMIVPNEFNYELNQEITLTVKLPSTVDYTAKNKSIRIYDNLPTEGGSLIHAGAADNYGVYVAKVHISPGLENLYVNSFAGWKVLSLGAMTKGFTDSYEMDYNEDYFNEPPDTTPDGQPVNSAGFLYSFQNFKSGGNFIGNPGFETNDFGTQADWSSLMQINQKWNITSQLASSYSLVDGPSGKAIQILGSGARYGGVTQLLDVDPGEEVTFTAAINKSGNCNSWLYLIPRDANQRPITYPYVQVTAAGWHSRTVTATMPANAATCQVLLWSHNYSGSILQYDNVVVSIKGRVTDSDGDGVEDDEDDYPNDANKAFNSYYPSEEIFGTLAFEDMWPNAGDYDFNDLVIGYRFNHISNSKNLITSLDITYQLRAIGASISNGFGFQLDLPPALIESVSNSLTFTSDQITLAQNGTEAGQEKANIIVFANAFDVLKHPGSGLGINTNPDIEYTTPADITIGIEFTEPITMEAIGNAPNNPYLFRTKDRSWEIHLPGYYPTSLVDKSKFGSGDDATNLDNEFLYKTAKGLPWGMNLPVSFIYPIEKAPIISAYLKFQQWAVSGGYSFMDWYKDVTGYRNVSKLYIVEE